MPKTRTSKAAKKTFFSETDLLLPFKVGQYRLSRFPVSMSAGVRSLSDLVRHGTNGDPPYGTCFIFVNDSKTIASIFAYDALGASRFITKWYPCRPGARIDVERFLPTSKKYPSPFVALTEDEFRSLLTDYKVAK